MPSAATSSRRSSSCVPGHEPTDKLARELQEHCKRVTAPYKYPREIEFIAELPKTRSGKIRRVELRQAELRKKGAPREWLRIRASMVST